MKFTDTTTKSLTPKNKRHIAWSPGHTCMGIRLSPLGRKTFVFMYRFENVSRMMSIGPYPRITLSNARLKAGEARAKLVK